MIPMKNNFSLAIPSLHVVSYFVLLRVLRKNQNSFAHRLLKAIPACVFRRPVRGSHCDEQEHWHSQDNTYAMAGFKRWLRGGPGAVFCLDNLLCRAGTVNCVVDYSVRKAWRDYCLCPKVQNTCPPVCKSLLGRLFSSCRMVPAGGSCRSSHGHPFHTLSN